MTRIGIHIPHPEGGEGAGMKVPSASIAAEKMNEKISENQYEKVAVLHFGL